LVVKEKAMTKVNLSRRAQGGRDRRARSHKRLVEAARTLFSERAREAVTVEEVRAPPVWRKGLSTRISKVSKSFGLGWPRISLAIWRSLWIR
jgi:hypothetical protein